MILTDSNLFFSYTFVPATSFNTFNRSLSLMFVKCVIWHQLDISDRPRQTHSSLRNDVVRIALAEPGALQQIVHLGLGRALSVQTVFIFLLADRTAQTKLG